MQVSRLLVFVFILNFVSFIIFRCCTHLFTMTTTATSPSVRTSASAVPPGSSSSADLLITPSLIESLLYPLHQLQQRQQMPVVVVSSSSPNSSRCSSSSLPSSDFYPPMINSCFENHQNEEKVKIGKTLIESAPVTTTSAWWTEKRPNMQRDLSKLGLLHVEIGLSGSTSTSSFSSSASSSLSSSCPNSPSSLNEGLVMLDEQESSATACLSLASMATIASTLSIPKNKVIFRVAFLIYIFVL